MANGKPRVFISGVSGEFESARNAVAADLRARGDEVTIQTDFRQGPDSLTLLKTLHDYIRDCSGVVCLVGQRTGGYPPAAVTERFKELLPEGVPEASYTQWEYLFARKFGRRLNIYFPNADWIPDEEAPADERQAKFVQWLKDQNIHWTPFSTIDQLARAVLKEDFSGPQPPPKPTPGKPIVLPYPSLGPLFKGREEFLRQLHQSLARGEGKTAITSNALYGLGGIGKSRAAVEYAWAHRDDYSALLFVVAETPEALRRNLAALAATLVPDLDTTDDTVRLQAVLDWLGTNPVWFLILDNADTKAALAEADALLAKLAGGHLVVTSRLADFSANFEPLALDVLSVNDAAVFLLERTKGRRRNAPDDAAKSLTVATELGGLALALEQAAAFIAKHRLTFESYLEKWRSAQHDEVLSWFDKETMTGYPRAVAVTWQTSVAQLTESGRRLLEHLAWFAPEKVPEFLLDVPIRGAKTENLHDTLADLAAYSLVARDAEGPSFLVHRLVQDVTRRTLRNTARTERLYEALAWVSDIFPGNSSDVRNWPKAELLAPHAQSLTEYAAAAGITMPTTKLMNELSMLLVAKAQPHEAEPLLRRALIMDEERVGLFDPTIAIDLITLADLLLDTNRLDEAECLIRRALAIDETFFGLNHIEVAKDLNFLANLLRRTKGAQEAESFMRRAVNIAQEMLGPRDPEITMYLTNLASLLVEVGQYGEAEQLVRRALSIDEEQVGSDHPQVAQHLENLGLLLKATQRRAEAEANLRRALSIKERTISLYHPTVASCLSNLAGLLVDLDKLDEAEQLMRRAVEILLKFEETTGHRHPNFESAISNYAGLLEKRGKCLAEVKTEFKMLYGERIRAYTE